MINALQGLNNNGGVIIIPFEEIKYLQEIENNKFEITLREQTLLGHKKLIIQNASNVNDFFLYFEEIQENICSNCAYILKKDIFFYCTRFRPEILQFPNCTHTYMLVDEQGSCKGFYKKENV